MITVGHVADFLENFAPSSHAADWDNVGLLVGDRSAVVERVMTCLTVTPESAKEAIDEGAHLIVSHHPMLFRPAKRLTSSTVEGRMLLDLIRAGVAVYSPHSSYDNCKDGINDQLAALLGLREIAPLRRGVGPTQFKIAVFVPEADVERVADAMFDAGAGHIGQYHDCSFRLPGTGTFFGSDATNPVIGEKGRREHVAEMRLEMVCPEARLQRVIATMRRAHPYEEVAFDVFPLNKACNPHGEGRTGRLPQPATLDALAKRVKDSLPANTVQIVGEGDKSIERVAIACGAAGEFLQDAVRSAADVFLTGEVRFHDCLAARAQGIALILPGHHATERPGVENLATRLQAQWNDVKVWASKAERDPLR